MRIVGTWTGLGHGAVVPPSRQSRRELETARCDGPLTASSGVCSSNAAEWLERRARFGGIQNTDKRVATVVEVDPTSHEHHDADDLLPSFRNHNPSMDEKRKDRRG